MPLTSPYASDETRIIISPTCLEIMGIMQKKVASYHKDKHLKSELNPHEALVLHTIYDADFKDWMALDTSSVATCLQPNLVSESRSVEFPN